MNVLIWHVHGSWMTAFVQGDHRYYVPLVSDRGPDGRGRARTWDWPESVIEITEEHARDVDFDVVVFQRPEEVERLAPRWLGSRRPGHDLAAVYVEHNAPTGHVNEMRHAMADRDDVTLVHVTNFNALFWDGGSTPTRIIEHAVVDPGYRYTGDVTRTAVVINEATRRGRVTGTDLLKRFAAVAPIDLFGIDAGRLGGHENLRQDRLHDAMAERRVYLHPVRWTSLGLSLIEAMYLGMPVVALATTEVTEAVPKGTGACSTSVGELIEALHFFHANPAAARRTGENAREFVRARYNLERFLGRWDALLQEVIA